MISYLSGKIIKKNEKSIFLNVNDIGYKVFLPSKRIENESLKGGAFVSFFCYTNTKKDPWEIYGFNCSEELDFFEFLIKIPSIGPKAALEVSCSSSLEQARKAIEENNNDKIENIFNLGEKKAQAIIFEISRKIKKNLSNDLSLKDKETVNALIKLGFDKKESEKAVASFKETELTQEQKIKKCLKKLSENK